MSENTNYDENDDFLDEDFDFFGETAHLCEIAYILYFFFVGIIRELIVFFQFEFKIL